MGDRRSSLKFPKYLDKKRKIMAKKHSWNNINDYYQISVKNVMYHIKFTVHGKAGRKPNGVNLIDADVISIDQKRQVMTLINGSELQYKYQKSNIKGRFLLFVCGCGNACTSLYFDEDRSLKCRKCLNLYYPSQMMAKGKKRDKAMALRVFMSYENVTKRYRNMVTRKGEMYYKAKEVLGI